MRPAVAFLCLGLVMSRVAVADEPPPESAPSAPTESDSHPAAIHPDLELPEARPAGPVMREPVGPWYRGPYARNRFTHIAITGALGLYVLSGYVFNTSLQASSCRWCNPPGFDNSARSALVWQNKQLADTLSTWDAYVLAPIVGLTLLVISDSDASPTRLIDDLLPAAETVAVVHVLTQLGKYAFARKRPYAYYADSSTTIDPTADNNSSFWSGHAVLGFAITSAAGTVCHFRQYKTEPYVWGTGIFLSLSTEYLRIAADKHYLTDVLAGGIVGLAAGILIPRLMRRDLKIVPIAKGVAVAGAF